MSKLSPCLYRGWPLLDGYSVLNLGFSALAAHAFFPSSGVPASQMDRKFFASRSAKTIDILVDRFVAYRKTRMVLANASGDLLGRPTFLEL
jgi:hypothetical protein